MISRYALQLISLILIISFASAITIPNYYCGDGNVDPGEDCEGGPGCVDCKCGGGITCEEVNPFENIVAGSYFPVCGTCMWMTTDCYCGDGVANNGAFGIFGADDECDLGSINSSLWEPLGCYPPESPKNCTLVVPPVITPSSCTIPTTSEECSSSGYQSCGDCKQLTCDDNTGKFGCECACEYSGPESIEKACTSSGGYSYISCSTFDAESAIFVKPDINGEMFVNCSLSLNNILSSVDELIVKSVKLIDYSGEEVYSQDIGETFEWAIVTSSISPIKNKSKVETYLLDYDVKKDDKALMCMFEIENPPCDECESDCQGKSICESKPMNYDVDFDEDLYSAYERTEGKACIVDGVVEFEPYTTLLDCDDWIGDDINNFNGFSKTCSDGYSGFLSNYGFKEQDPFFPNPADTNRNTYCFNDTNNDGIGDFANCSYCKNPGMSESNTDNINSNCQPELFVKLDPMYIHITKKYRGFYPTKITPFDDIVCFSDDKKVAGYPVKLMTVDDNGEYTVKITSGVMDENAEWKIDGWDDDGTNNAFGSPRGWTDDEDIIKQIVDTKKVQCVMDIEDGNSVSVDNSDKMRWLSEYSNCLHVWGSDSERKIVLHYGESTDYSSIKMVDRSISYLLTLFEYSPFRESKTKLSAYSDLNLIMGDEDVETYNIEVKKHTFFLQSAIEPKVDSESACVEELSGGILYHNLEHDVKEVYPGYASGFSFGLQYIKDSPIWLSARRIEVVFVHEFGHSFGGLQDEYQTKETDKNKKAFYDGYDRNCNAVPIWNIYGNIVSGCYSGLDYIRPSENSVMRKHYLPNAFFNVVSCGYILQNLGECNEMSDCWDKCMNEKWNTIKPIGEKLCGYNQPFDPDSGLKCCIDSDGKGTIGEKCCGNSLYGYQAIPSEKSCCINNAAIYNQITYGDMCCGVDSNRMIGFNPANSCCNKKTIIDVFLVEEPSQFQDPSNPKYGDCS